MHQASSPAGRVLTVARMGHPILKQVSAVVTNPKDPEISQLIRDMKATVDYLDCTGLAAPQVFCPVRIVLFRIMKVAKNPKYKLTPEFDPEGVPWTLMINPKIILISDQKNSGYESCLSLPGLIGNVPRFHSVRYEFIDENGNLQQRTAHGFHARVVQHECDHLDGILYPQRMDSLDSFSFQEEAFRYSDSE